MYVIQLDGWENVRIAGEDHDWQIQKLVHRKGGDTWEGTNFYPALQYAVGEMYERTVRRRGRVAKEPNAWLEDCKAVKDELIAAVEKAVS